MAKFTAEERFLAKVDKTDTCWIWTAYKNGLGYGHFWLDGQLAYAHRISYEFHVGPIPEGMHLDHTCHQPSCVNPEHLRPVTNKQNMENRSGAQPNNQSGVRGVHWHKRDRRWHARVRHNGKQLHLGYFTELEDAEEAVIAKRNELFTHNDVDRNER